MGTWYPSGGGGGGGSAAVVESYDAEVATEDALQTAVTAGGRILVTADIALTSNIALPGASTPVWIDLADGVVVTGVSDTGAGVFLANGTDYDLTVYCGRDASFDAGVSNAVLVLGNITANSKLHGHPVMTTNAGTWNGLVFDASPMDLDLDWWTIHIKNASNSWVLPSLNCRIGGITLLGGGSNAYVNLNNGLKFIPKVECKGTLRYNSALTSSNYSIKVDGCVGVIESLQSSVSVYIAANASVLRIEAASPRVLLGDSAALYSAYWAVVFLDTASSELCAPSVHGASIFGFTSNDSSNRWGVKFFGCQFDGSTVDTSNTKGMEFHGCTAEDVTMTFAAGTYPLWNGGRIDNAGSGSLTIEAGAYAQIRSVDLDNASITNNDPGTLITGSTDVSDDTDPTTRRFGHATLDALLPHIIAFWPGDELPEPSKAPVAGRSAGSSMQPLTAASVVGANGFDAPTTAEGFAATCPFYYWSKFAEFTLSFVLRPVDATPPAGRSLIQWASQRNSLGFNVNYESTGQLNVFSNPTGGAPVVGASGFIGAFSDDTDTRVTFALRNNGGTGTIYGYADGVEVLTWTGFNPGLMLEYLILASRSTGNLGFPAAYRNVYVFDIGLTEAQENLLDSSSLKGAGIA